MKTIVKFFLSAAIIATLYSCDFFGTKEAKEDPKKDPNEQSIDTTGKKIDTLNTVEGPAKDTGIVIKEEVKVEAKN